MKIYTVAIILIIGLAVDVYAEEYKSKINVSSRITPYFGTNMRLDFTLDEVDPTPECQFTDKSFPLSQSAAIELALNWATNDFDNKQKWRVSDVSLHFVSVSLNSSRCVYIVELMPVDKMESLAVGVLMSGKVIPPVQDATKIRQR